MRPLAIKLDLLQGDKNSFLGCLLPHLIHLNDQLTALLKGEKGTLIYTRPIVKVIQKSIREKERFGHIFDNMDYRVASSFHPGYKLNWIRMWRPDKVDEVREMMVTMVAEELRAADPDLQAAQPVTAERMAEASTSTVAASMDIASDDENIITHLCNQFYQPAEEVQSPQKTFTEIAKELVKTWETTPATTKFDDAAFMDNPIFVDLFRKTNTGVVSSAACERFFSQGKDTLRAKREGMSANNFEALMFLKGNGHLWAVPNARKRRDAVGKMPHPVLEHLTEK